VAAFEGLNKFKMAAIAMETKVHFFFNSLQYILNPPFFVSMATAAKFVQPIPILLSYLVSLDVDVVRVKFHQFLFGD
jgi:hypothetical protein